MKKKIFQFLAAVTLLLGFVSVASPAEAEVPPGTQSCHFTAFDGFGWTTHSGSTWSYSQDFTKPAPGCFDVQVNHTFWPNLCGGTYLTQAFVQVETVNSSGVHMAWGSEDLVQADVANYVILWSGMPTGQHFRIWSKTGSCSTERGSIMY